MKNMKRIIFFRESFVQSLLSDLVTLGALFVLIWVSKGSSVWSIVSALVWFIWLFTKVKIRTKAMIFNNIDDLKAYVDRLQKNRSKNDL